MKRILSGIRQITATPATRSVVSIALALCLLSLSAYLGWFGWLDRWLYDLGMNSRTSEKSLDNVVIVAIDRGTVENFFEPPAYPVSRHLDDHRRLVERLTEAQADIVAFDILFDQIGDLDTADVASFAGALTEHGKVILVASIETIRGTEHEAVTARRLLQPGPVLRQAALATAVVDMPYDRDARLRRCYYSKTLANTTLSSLAATICQFRKDTVVAMPESRDWFYIDYALQSRSIPTVSFADVLEREGWQEKVRHKIVLIGVTDPSARDRYLTPLSASAMRQPDQRLPGVTIQALAVATLLNASQPEPTDLWLLLIAGAVLVILAASVLCRMRALPGLVLTAATLVAVLLLGVLPLALWGVVMNVSFITVGLVTAGLAVVSLNYAAARLSSETKGRELEVVGKDLSDAHILQQNLQPKVLPERPWCRLAALQIPCREVGGDYYDVIDFPDGRLGILIADVSGKGVAGSLIMSNVQGRFRKIAPSAEKPSEVLAELNLVVGEATKTPSKFVTLFYGVFDANGRRFEYGCAGHNPPLVCNREGIVTELHPSGPMLGPFSAMTWEDHELETKPGDTLLLYTDGVTEAGGDNPADQYGEQRLKELLTSIRQTSVEQVRDAVVSDCRGHVKGMSFDDDLTLLVVRLS